MLLVRLGRDPAVASSILLTTVTDIAGFFSFLGLATVLSSLFGVFSDEGVATACIVTSRS